METTRVAEALNARIPLALMTSFSTDEIVRAHVAERSLGDPFVFGQFAAPRLRPDGSLFRDAGGRVSLYGPGHGDLLKRSGRPGRSQRSESSAFATSSCRTSTTSAGGSIPR